MKAPLNVSQFMEFGVGLFGRSAYPCRMIAKSLSTESYGSFDVKT